MVESQKALADRLFPVVPQPEELELRNIPPEQRRLHTETADLTVQSIHQYLASGKLLIPEFQRGYVWNRTQASRLIESLIIQCPIPVVYLSQGSDNNLSVIDGNQRILSIKLFINDAYQLQGLTTYPELNGVSWSTLDPRIRDHILNRTIRCITILKDTHPQIKFDVFERLNTGAVKLNAQELRHGLNHGPLMEELDRLTSRREFQAATGIKRDTRMRGAELVLRFFALRYNRQNYTKPLSGFLDVFSTTHRTTSMQAIEPWVKDFVDTLDAVSHAYGRLAFKIYEEDLSSTSAFNAALYDAEMIGFSETNNDRIKSRRYEPTHLQRSFQALFREDRFNNSIRQATSDEIAVRTRIDRVKQFLENF